MATMVKEKRREKKKSKEKKATKTDENIYFNTSNESVDETYYNEADLKTAGDLLSSGDAVASTSEISVSIQKEILEPVKLTIVENVCKDTIQLSKHKDVEQKTAPKEEEIKATEISHSAVLKNVNEDNIESPKTLEESKTHEQIQAKMIQTSYLESYNAQNSYEALNSKLRIRTMNTSQTDEVVLRNIKEDVLPSDTKEIRNSEESVDISTKSNNTESQLNDKVNTLTLEPQKNGTENVIPSAPVLEEDVNEQIQYIEPAPIYVAPKTECMPLDEAIRLCGGKEIAEIKAMSEREEIIVEAGPVSGPEHPLVDLLLTFRSSLMAVDRERTKLTVDFIEEEKFRSTLWKVEKRHVNMRKKCPCGLNVDLKGVYEHAELLKERLPVAKMRLESLLRDVQESYCHHQHSALLAHCQIEDLIYQTIQSNKSAIRETLSLVLEALRLSDGGGAGGASVLLSAALQRWAKALSAALLDGRDVRQLLHLLHHLFRQSRSVYWAASVIHLNVRDRVEAAQAIAILDLMLNKTKVETAVECTEGDVGASEGWEEVTSAGGGAVMAGRARERDLCAILTRLPLQQLVATVTLFTHNDVTRARQSDWGDSHCGRGVLWSCCAARALLNVLHRALTAHAQYNRLKGIIRNVARSLLHALAALHLHSRSSYSTELEVKIAAELEAVFAASFTLFGSEGLEALPATLLSDTTAKDYCLALIAGLHDKTSKRLDSPPIKLPVLPCADRVRVVTRAAVDRAEDRQLAAMVLDFLIQTGIKNKSVTCKGSCEKTARELLAKLLTAHPYLYPMALHMVADLSQVETLDASCIACLRAGDWRPRPAEAVAALSDWSKRCASLLPHLLMALNYTPHTGLSLETQLSIGAWLCSHVSESAESAEWWWAVLRRLRVHRAWWAGRPAPGDAPPPHTEPENLFSMAYAVLATSWGHSIPIICSDGVHALCKLAQSRCADAAHCLGPVMLVMANSPESVSLTPKFEELFQIILGHGPSLVQRALGRGPPSGPDLLLTVMLAQLENKCPEGVLSAWIHGLWRRAARAVRWGGAPLLDAALLATRNWHQFDNYVTALLMEDNYKEHLNAAVRCSTTAPLITECALRSAHAQRETLVWFWPRLLDGLHAQRLTKEKIHVDNLLKMMGTQMTSDDLVLSKTAAAAQSAAPRHPAHLALWRLLMYLYLQRPPAAPSASAVGTLFFSGIIKTRTLGQLKKKLLETANYHANERKSLLSKPKEEPNEQSQNEPRNTPVEDSLLSEISMVDLAGESSDAESSGTESSESKSSGSDSNYDSTMTETRDTESALDSETEHLIVYHASAEKMLREFLTWLEQGDKVQAMPHHADISRFIPEHALDAAWRRELWLRRPPVEGDTVPSPLSPVNAAPAPAAKTPFQMAVDAIKRIRDRSRRRSRRPSIKSPIGDLNVRDTRALLKLVDKYLNEIETLARDWSSEIDRICCLDERLWSLVVGLRVRRSVPPVRKKCANNCMPLTFVIPEEEWCISTGAENGIKENRASARACVRRVSRPRPHAASTVAALFSVVRVIPTGETAGAVCARLWRGAARRESHRCALASAALTTLCTDLAEKWLCSDGKACASLISSWANSSNTELQQSLCGALVSPRRLQPQQWPAVYIAILQSKLPSHAIFSYLSRFEMSRWCEYADSSLRRDMLEALSAAAQRWGALPPTDHHVLLELLVVHTSTLLDCAEVYAQCRRCALGSAAGALPPRYWRAVGEALRTLRGQLSFDQLGHTLRELGMTFWDSRASAANKKKSIDYTMYAPNIAEVLHELQRAFVTAGMMLAYAPEKVGRYAWCSLQESWSPWVSPHALPPLLPSTGDHEQYTTMLQSFVQCVGQVMEDCPGSEAILLQQCFTWLTQTYSGVYTAGSQEGRVQASAALAALAGLPWAHCQWLSEDSVNIACQISSSTDVEIKSWCAERWRYQSAQTWLCGVTQENIAQRLAVLLQLFTTMAHTPETLEQATLLPWPRFPEMALDSALTHFFQHHYNPAQPYHELPQFRVLLFACELCMPSSTTAECVHTSGSVAKRLTAVSQWTRAATAPALVKHVAAYSEKMLEVIGDLAPYLSGYPGELEELLSRALVVMCVEPAAASALPVWLNWIRNCQSSQILAACVTAVASITAFQYYAALADCAVAAYMTTSECSGWSEITRRLVRGPWREPAPLCAAGHLHAAYGVAAALQGDLTGCTAAFNVLASSSASVNFAENELIVALWVCLMCRVTAQCQQFEGGQQTEGSTSWSVEDAQSCLSSGRSALTGWAAAPRRSIISVVTLQQQANAPTAKIRLLASLAVCAVGGREASEAAARAYQVACAQLLGNNCHEMSWATEAVPRRVPQLACRLFPNAEKYFKDELDVATRL